MNTIKENSKAAFNQQAATYDKDIKGQHARSLYPILLEKLSHIPFHSALDLGCGTGEMLKLIFQKDTHKELCGIDLSEEMLAVAKSKLPEQVKLLLGDSESLPFPDNPRHVSHKVYRMSLSAGDCSSNQNQYMVQWYSSAVHSYAC